MTPTIKRGAIVRLTTTNGGEAWNRLAANYVETYDAVVYCGYHGDHIAIIPASRIKSIEEVTIQ